MNIPLMNRLIASGKWEESLRVVKRDIALPAVLGRICPAPCEGVCHRKTVDEAVSICLLKRFVGDAHDLHPWPVPPTGLKKVAVIGAGPAGLAAAYYLQLKGVQAALFDRDDQPGGKLRTAINDEILPSEVLDREINSILGTGVTFKGNTTVNDVLFEELRQAYDAVVVATGNIDDLTKSFELAGNPKGLDVDRKTYETSEKGIFAIGNVLRTSKLAVRSVGAEAVEGATGQVTPPVEVLPRKTLRLPSMAQRKLNPRFTTAGWSALVGAHEEECTLRHLWFTPKV